MIYSWILHSLSTFLHIWDINFILGNSINNPTPPTTKQGKGEKIKEKVWNDKADRHCHQTKRTMSATHISTKKPNCFTVIQIYYIPSDSLTSQKHRNPRSINMTKRGKKKKKKEYWLFNPNIMIVRLMYCTL